MIKIITSEKWTDIPVDRNIFGNFIELGFGRQINGLWGEMLFNRAFREVPPFRQPTWDWLGINAEMYNENAPFWHSGYEACDWEPVGSPEMRRTLGTHTFKGLSSLMIENCNNTGRCGISQGGLHLQQGRQYALRLFAGIAGSIGEAGLNGFGIPLYAEGTKNLFISMADFHAECLLTAECREYSWVFTAKRTEVARLVLDFDWIGTVVLSWTSLMPLDNVNGWRCDVIEKLREIAPAVVRFPGGCFVSFYDWESAIGNRNAREPMPSHYWGGLEENDVGLDEFMCLSELIGFQAQICFNMMSSTPYQARQLVEYLNAPADVGMGRLRMLNGHPEPYGVRLFEMDNEPSRKWTARQYSEQCVAFSREMRLADPGIQLMFAAYAYPLEALTPMLNIAGLDVDFVIYRQGDPDFVEQVLPVIHAYNERSGTNLRLANTEWLPSCHSPEPFSDPAIPTDFHWSGEITNDYKTIFSVQQRSWNYALNGAHRLLDYIGYGGVFALANFNNMCNTWGQNVIEATKDECYLSCMGLVFSFFHRIFVPCYACKTETANEQVHAQMTKGLDGKLRLYCVNHSSSPQQVKLPEGDWVLLEAIAGKDRLTAMNTKSGDVISCKVDIMDGTAELPPLSILCLHEQ